MEAVELIEATRGALEQSTTVPAVIAEVWQAQALAIAVGGHLAASGPLVLRAEARDLSEAGTRPGGFPGAPGAPRAARLSRLGDTRCVLIELGALLGEAGAALVRVAVSAEEEGLYWKCTEAVEMVDQSTDRVTSMLRSLALGERNAMR